MTKHAGRGPWGVSTRASITGTRVSPIQGRTTPPGGDVQPIPARAGSGIQLGGQCDATKLAVQRRSL